MGSPADEQGRKGLSTYRKRSRPWLDVDEEQHRVRLTRSYLMMTTEVTQSQYELTVGSNPSSLPACGPDCPVENVTLQDVHTYADKLSSEEGLEICYGGADPARRQILSCKGYRLPTEAEWEYAGRAGEIRATQNGNLTIKGPLQAPELDSIAWYAGNSEVTYRPAGKCTVWPTQRMGGAPPQESCGPHPVGTKLANAWGLHDMLGNVWEWTADIVGPYESNATDPLSSITPTSIAPAEQATRGGCWGTAPELARLAARVGVFEGSPRGHVGFRLVRTVP
jgi:formylglycine-generating enzyme required for sulfatase activity